MRDAETGWDLLSSTSSQVLLCDLQKQIVARSKTNPPEDLAKSAGVLLQLAELFKLPVTLSVVPEQQKAPKLVPELAQSKAPQMLRSSASPFLDPATTKALEAQSRPMLLLGGFATEVVVLHAALDALKLGYKVLVAVDACGGMSERTEQAALRQIEAAGGISTSVVSLATKLSPDFSSPLGQQMFQLLQKLRLS